MSNTVIQLKYSSATAVPPALNVGEPAYSFTSNKLFIGNTTNGVLTIGGKYYVDRIEANTALATAGTIVLRDSNASAAFNVVTANSFVGAVVGNAATASKLLTARDIGLSGDLTGNVSFDGSANVTLTAELTDTGVAAGTYGSTTNIPVITVDVDGRVTSLSNAAISTTLNIAADTGANAVSLATGVLTVVGGDGITTSISPTNNVNIVVDSTVIKTDRANQTINGNVSITGSLTVTGNLFSQNVTSYNVDDPLIYLAANNYTSDIVDIGFAGNYFDGTSQRHTGLVRIHGTNEMYAFTNVASEFSDNLLNVSDPTLRLANVHSNLVGGRVFNLSDDITVSDGGTGRSTFTAGEIIIGNGTNGLLTLANTGTAGTYANASYVPVITTDAYGRVSGVTPTIIAIATTQITSGILDVARGGTGAGTFTANGVLLGQGTGAVTTVSSSTEGHVLTIDGSGAPIFAMLSGGTF